jgi:hypothetical protein
MCCLPCNFYRHGINISSNSVKVGGTNGIDINSNGVKVGGTNGINIDPNGVRVGGNNWDNKNFTPIIDNDDNDYYDNTHL